MARGESNKIDFGERGKPTVGTYIAYDKAGKEIWRKEDFTRSHDSVPRGISITMGAGKCIDPKTGEVQFQWNPWNII